MPPQVGKWETWHLGAPQIASEYGREDDETEPISLGLSGSYYLGSYLMTAWILKSFLLFDYVGNILLNLKWEFCPWLASVTLRPFELALLFPISSPLALPSLASPALFSSPSNSCSDLLSSHLPSNPLLFAPLFLLPLPLTSPILFCSFHLFLVLPSSFSHDWGLNPQGPTQC